MASRKCRCGKTIAFVRVGDRLVPVDPTATVYVVQVGRRSGELEGVAAKRLLDTKAPAYLVNHFSTCTDADQFTQSRSKKQLKLDVLVGAVKRLNQTPINWAQFAEQNPKVNAAIVDAVSAADELTK